MPGMGSDDAERLDGGREQDAAFDAAAGDVAHVDEALGGGALTQHPRRSVVNQRVRRTVTKRLRRAIEVGFYRCPRFPPLVAHLLAPPCDFVAIGCRFRGHAAIGIILGAFGIGFFC